jgi:hypothetical protein
MPSPLLAPFDSSPRCNIMAAIEATTEPYGLVVPEVERAAGGCLLKQQCRLSPIPGPHQRETGV